MFQKMRNGQPWPLKMSSAIGAMASSTSGVLL